tara:strand:- start:917 stop:1129 length:213 start_codon:yes stop_codon:yes gene_type:complete
MNRGNIVMFTGQGVYAKYFFGQFAVVMSSSISKSSKKEFVRVEWLSPVKYNEGHTTTSDLLADKFTLVVK